MRQAVLALAKSPAMRAFMRRRGRALGARRFVAGERSEEALGVVRQLGARGLLATLDILGEEVASLAEARLACQQYTELLGAIAQASLACGVSIKLTQMGLDVDRAACEELVEAVLQAAERAGRFVRIDMEDATHTDATLDLFGSLRPRHPRLGVVIQACLRRSREDMKALGRADVRLVKGAYRERPEVAVADKREVDRAFEDLARAHLLGGGRLAIATHDERIIGRLAAFIEALGVPGQRYEFQMLYGIRPDLQQRLAREGHRVRIYVPFGPHWYPYLMRRLAERPANLAFFLKNLIRL